MTRLGKARQTISATFDAAVVAGLIAAAGPVMAADAVEPLGGYVVEPGSVTVSGVSSGGYMAHQMHIAYSDTVTGAGIIAAGPYYCAGGGYPFNLYRALNICMDFSDPVPFLGPPDIAGSLEEVRLQAVRGRISTPEHLADDRVFLFSGRLDELIPQPMMNTLDAFYAELVDPDGILYVDNIRAAHAMITDTFGNACDAEEAPYINDCDYDAAGIMLQHFYGELRPRAEPTGDLIAFDQREFAEDLKTASLADVGYAYVPSACAAGAACRVHVAFHGCRQYAGAIGDAFTRHAGYNSWAEANDIIVLYPQTTPTQMTLFGVSLPWPNPRGCWDWWGYSGSDYALKSGPQMQAVKAMIDRLGGR